MSVGWVDYKGKKILYCNYLGVKKETDAITVLKSQMKLIVESKEPVLLLVNMADTVMTPETTAFAKGELAKVNDKVKKAALVGIKGFKTVIVDSIGRQADMNQQVFGSEEEAKDWLVS